MGLILYHGSVSAAGVMSPVDTLEMLQSKQGFSDFSALQEGQIH